MGDLTSQDQGSTNPYPPRLTWGRGTALAIARICTGRTKYPAQVTTQQTQPSY
jgi:hypothetical protein